MDIGTLGLHKEGPFPLYIYIILHGNDKAEALTLFFLGGKGVEWCLVFDFVRLFPGKLFKLRKLFLKTKSFRYVILIQ